MNDNPYPEPSLLFTPEEVAAVDWERVFEAWDKPAAEPPKPAAFYAACGWE